MLSKVIRLLPWKIVGPHLLRSFIYNLIKDDKDRYAQLLRYLLKDRAFLDPLLKKLSPNIGELRLLQCTFQYVGLIRPHHPASKILSNLNDEARLTPEDYSKIRELLVENLPIIHQKLDERINQQNLVRRCGLLYPAVCLASNLLGNSRIGLIDIGTSAGFLLGLDKYSYNYGPRGKYGDLRSPVQISFDVSGAELPDLSSPPEITKRIGIDLTPVDLKDADALAWSRSFVLDKPEELECFDKAIEVVKRLSRTIYSDNVLQVFPKLVNEIPIDSNPLLITSMVVGHFESRDREKFKKMVSKAGKSRNLAWLSLEFWNSKRKGLTELKLTISKGGIEQEYILAYTKAMDGAGPHFIWLGKDYN